MEIENLYSLASQVSALATLGSLPFGKATHASVVSFTSEKKLFYPCPPSWFCFGLTTIRSLRLAKRKTGFPKMFLKKTFWDEKSIGASSALLTYTTYQTI